uniref:Uncharacterized protein n=1 Tax=Acrobeloides nanus TaxID=290746 RepID=A0A914EF64_9BILA
MDEMATSYRTSMMARTMSRRTFIVRQCILLYEESYETSYELSYDTSYDASYNKMHCRTTNFVRCHRTASYDHTTACGDFIVLLH